MKTLPYFLKLVKQNVILYAIITSGKLTAVDLSDTDHYFWTDEKISLDIKNFSLNEIEKFDKVNVSYYEKRKMIVVAFYTKDPKYFDSPSKYFNMDAYIKYKNPYRINDLEVSTRKKNIGTFHTQSLPPVRVTLFHSSAYDYSITLWFSI